MKKIRVRLTAGGEEVEGFLDIEAKPIKLKGFEQYEFVIHRPMKTNMLEKPGTKNRYGLERSGWTVSEVSTGSRAVRRSHSTQKAAIQDALECLETNRAKLSEVIKARQLVVAEAQRRLLKPAKRRGVGGSNL